MTGQTGNFDLPTTKRQRLYLELRQTVEDAERQNTGITDSYGWRAAAARALKAHGVSRSTTYRWLERLKGLRRTVVMSPTLNLPPVPLVPAVVTGTLPAVSALPDLPLLQIPIATQPGPVAWKEELVPAVPAVMPFSFEGAKVRVTTRDGDPWFVLTDVCRVLDIGNSRQAAVRLRDREKGVIQADTPGGRQAVTIISEPGLWRLVLRSDKPSAERFQDWVVTDVLPTIRKTGGYQMPTALPPPMDEGDLLARALLVASDRMKGLERRAVVAEAEVIQLKPLAQAHLRLEASEGSLCLTDTAKHMKVARNVLIRWLHGNGWIYKRAGGSKWLPYSVKEKAGLLELVKKPVPLRDGTERIGRQTKITVKGLATLAKVMQPGGFPNTARIGPRSALLLPKPAHS